MKLTTSGDAATPASHARLDPRIYQIGSLFLLLLFGVTSLGFDIAPGRIALLLFVSLAAQLAGTRLAGLPRFDPKSALISGLSLCLLLRTGSAALAALAACAAIGGKFLLRVNGKHLFNPTNLGIVSLLLLSGGVWVSPGQWGNAAFLGFLFACLGGLVVNRAARSDVTFAFLATYLALVFGRSLWLGEPLAIPVHRLSSGALLLFAFFMISDPKTTPDARAARILFGVLVAFGGWYWQFRLFRTNGLLLSLAAFSLLVPLLDRLLPGKTYDWNHPEGKKDEDEARGRILPLAPPLRPAHTPRVLRLLRGEG